MYLLYVCITIGSWSAADVAFFVHMKAVKSLSCIKDFYIYVYIANYLTFDELVRPFSDWNGHCSATTLVRSIDRKCNPLSIPSGTIAQLGERAIEVRKVAGSIPARPIVFFFFHCYLTDIKT